MIVLASRSPRRLELLRQIGIQPEVLPVPVDETPAVNEAPEAYVRRITQDKAEAGAALRPHQAILAADTAVILDRRILGKPKDEDDAIQMLLALSGRTHQVLSGVALWQDQVLRYRLSRSRVRFRPISMHEARDYWRSGEPRDKAGGYAIQGQGALFVEHICGSYSGIMGLPLFETGALLKQAGIGYRRGENQ